MGLRERVPLASGSRLSRLIIVRLFILHVDNPQIQNISFSLGL